MNTRQVLLLACVMGAALLVLTSCAVTQWQRDQDAMASAFRELHSADMERRIAEAQGLKVAQEKP